MQKTNFNNIYCLNNTTKTDREFCAMPIYLQYAINWRYLQFAIAYFKHLYKSEIPLDDYVAFYEQSYEFVGDGVDGEFLLSPQPTYNDVELYVAKFIEQQDEDDEDSHYQELKINEYTYDIDTGILKIHDVPEDKMIVKVVVYRDGYFNSDLDVDVKVILSEGMNIPFLEKNQNNTKLLNQIVYGGTMKMFSQGEHMKQLGNIVNNQRDYVRELIINYSYLAESKKTNKPRLSGLVSDSGARTKKYSRKF